jgi:carbonic anhydrase/acetyltransferase-like protein (isoleucine patch superfamily)
MLVRLLRRNFATFSLGGAAPKVHANAWIAPTASVIGNVVMDERSSVWFGATVRGDNETITIGPETNVQDGSVLHYITE